MMIHHWFVRRQVLINLNDWRILEDTKPFPGRDRRDFWQEIIMTVATFCPESNWWTRADATNVCWPQSGTGAGHLWNLWNLIRIKIELRMWFWKMILVVSPNLPGVYLCNAMYFNRVKKSLFHHVMHQRSGTDHQLTTRRLCQWQGCVGADDAQSQKWQSWSIFSACFVWCMFDGLELSRTFHVVPVQLLNFDGKF